MKITWYGHSAFRIEMAASTILIDPFLDGNPSWNGGWQVPGQGATHVALTHGHNDHVGNTLDILKATGAMLVANYEICRFMVGQGVEEDRINPASTGGTVECGGFTVTLVQAQHASSYGNADGSNTYLGNPNGLVIHSANEKTLYHMGDTDIFGDMALIRELHEPQIGLVPVGDRFTMGGAVAALACRRFFAFETVIPCHYGSFPIIDATADTFIEGMQGSETTILTPEPGVAVKL